MEWRFEPLYASDAVPIVEKLSERMETAFHC